MGAQLAVLVPLVLSFSKLPSCSVLEVVTPTLLVRKSSEAQRGGSPPRLTRLPHSLTAGRHGRRLAGRGAVSWLEPMWGGEGCFVDTMSSRE